MMLSSLARRRWRGIWSLGGVGAAMLAVAACGSQSTAGSGTSKTGSITLGAVLSQTGPAAIYGVQQVKGIQLYLAAVNAAGGVDGRKVTLSVRDDGSQPSRAATQMQQLLTTSAMAVVGPTEPPSLALMAPIADRQHIPMISFALSTAVQSPWWFRAAWNNDATVDAVIKHLAKLGLTKVGVLYPDDSGGQAGITTIKQLAPKDRVRIVASQAYPGDTTDPTVQALNVIAAHPDAFIVWDSANTSRLALTVKTLRAHGATQPIGAPEAAAASGFSATAGAAARGVFYWGAFASDDPTAQQVGVVKAWKAKYGTAPNDTDLAGYAQAQILVGALEFLAKSHKPINRSNMRQAIESLSGLQTVYGDVNYGASNHDDPFGPVPLVQYTATGAVRVKQ